AVKRGERAALYLLSESDPARLRAEPQQRRFERIGARIATAPDAMAETHQTFATTERALEPGIDVLNRADRVEHVEYRARRAAMKRPGQGAIAAEHGRRQRSARRGDDPHRKGRRGEAVVDDNGEIAIERARQGRRRRRPGRHAEEIGRGAKARI